MGWETGGIHPTQGTAAPVAGSLVSLVAGVLLVFGMLAISIAMRNSGLDQMLAAQLAALLPSARTEAYLSAVTGQKAFDGAAASSIQAGVRASSRGRSRPAAA